MVDTHYLIKCANLPILLKTFKLVKSADNPIKIMETIVPEAFSSKPLYWQKDNINCPIDQINPPTQNALRQFLRMGELGDFLFT